MRCCGRYRGHRGWRRGFWVVTPTQLGLPVRDLLQKLPEHVDTDHNSNAHNIWFFLVQGSFVCSPQGVVSGKRSIQLQQEQQQTNTQSGTSASPLGSHSRLPYLWFAPHIVRPADLCPNSSRLGKLRARVGIESVRPPRQRVEDNRAGRQQSHPAGRAVKL